TFLRERVVWRSSPIEYGFYEQRRWHEHPAYYVERALRAALHKTARVHITDDLRVPSLRVAVSAFDEVLAPAHAAVVEGPASLHEPHGRVLPERPFVAAVPIAGDDPAAMAHAMGEALDDVATRIAEAVVDVPPPRVEASGRRSRRTLPRPAPTPTP